MEVKLFFVFLAFANLKCTCSLTETMSGNVFEQTTFLHKIFPVPPSVRATIEVDVSYFKTHVEERSDLMMGIYTTQDNINIVKQCTHTQYGQLGNKELFSALTMNQDLSGPLRCEKTDLFHRPVIRCKGTITVQDYIPRIFSFSLGFSCELDVRYRSLQELQAYYKFTIHVTNEITCSELQPGQRCQNHIKFGIFPNLFGEAQALSHIESAECYALFPLATKSLCYLFISQCDPKSKRIIPPCREMCLDYLDGCSPYLGNEASINCSYLPSFNGYFPCFYEPFIGCNEPPPTLTNSKVISHFTKRDKYLLHSRAEYTCYEGFRLKGNKTINCRFDGSWSTPPKCYPEDKTKTKIASHFLVVGTLLVLLLMLFVSLGCRIMLKTINKLRLKGQDIVLDFGTDKIELPFIHERRKDHQTSSDTASLLKRNRTFDATIFYHFDTDDIFVVNKLLPELEEFRNFKLCIHSRNFTPGRDINDNIEESINNSNSVVIVMSQGFVDSMWCKEEFTHCYIENMKDPAFCLFVIMMQPVDTLRNVSNYMRTFFYTKTYLDVNDPQLFTKLVAHLENTRRSKEDTNSKIESGEIKDDYYEYEVKEYIRGHDISRKEETLVMQETTT